MSQRDLEWDVLNGVVNKLPYNDIETAYNKIKTGLSSIVLTHRLAMVKNGLLYVDMLPVGIFSPKKKKITCLPAYAPIFYEFLKTGDGNVAIETKHE